MTDNPNPNRKKQIKLNIPPELKAVYSNLAVMSSTRNEMVINFAQMLPPDPRATVQSRVVMTPQHAKLLMTLLQRNIANYEAQHGEIEITVPTSLADQLFRGVGGDDDDDTNG
ncbi:MAG: DUF3467 domain-containing protein [Chloroflexota bacterium]